MAITATSNSLCFSSEIYSTPPPKEAPTAGAPSILRRPLNLDPENPNLSEKEKSYVLQKGLLPKPEARRDGLCRNLFPSDKYPLVERVQVLSTKKATSAFKPLPKNIPPSKKQKSEENTDEFYELLGLMSCSAALSKRA